MSEEKPLEPLPSQPMRPGEALVGSQMMMEQWQILTRLEDELPSKLEEISHRLELQEQILKDLSRRKANLKVPEAKDSFQTQDSAASMASSEKVVPVSLNKKASYDSWKPRRRASLRSAGTGLFPTFTQADLALRQRAAAVDGQINRERFKDHQQTGPKSVEKQKLPGWLGAFVKHPLFDSFFATVVLINTVFIAVEVQETIWSESKPSIFLTVTQYGFTGLFTVELALRFMAFGFKELWYSDEYGWILLDMLIVFTSLVDMAVTLAIRSGGMADDILNITGFKAFRIIRVTRILKTLRLVRVFRFIMALRTLVTSIVYTLRSLFWAMALLLLIVFVFAVLLVEAVSDNVGRNPLPEMELDVVMKYYGSLPRTMLALFMSISGGVSWEECIEPLLKMSTIWAIVYLFYVAFTYFAVLNVVTGVFCQSAIDSAQNDHANVVQSMLANKEAHIEKIRALFSQLGADKTGVITYAMFEEGIQTNAVIEYFETLGLDVWDAWSFFKLLDLDAGGSVEIEEFFKGCLRLRGGARGVDLGKLLHDQSWLIKAQGRFQSYVEVKLNELSDSVEDLAGRAPRKSSFVRGMSPLSAEERCQ